MLRRSRTNPLYRHIILLMIIPLTVSGVGYAVFSQNLTVNGSGSDVAYSSSQYLLATYAKTATVQGSDYLYSMATTIKNNGVTSVTAWQFKFDIPTNATTLTCPSSVTCTRAGDTVTVVNGAGNGTIPAGGATNFTFSFVSATANYTLQNVIISGTFATTFQTISGLTVTINAGTSKKKGAKWEWTPTITVTNNSGQSLSGWRVTVTPWATAYAVTSGMPTGISFTTTATQLQFTSTNVLSNGASYQLIPTITTNTATWNPTATVQGRA